MKRITSFIAFTLAFCNISLAQPIPCPPNIDFETGTFQLWTTFIGNSQSTMNTYTAVWQGAAPPVAGRHTITSGTSTNLWGGFPEVAPGGGSYSVKLGDDLSGFNCERIRYFIHVPNNANNYSFIYKFAIVLENPQGHDSTEQPRFSIKAYDSVTLDTIPCTSRNYVGSTSQPIPGFDTSLLTGPGGALVTFLPWSTGSINLSGQAGKTIVIDVENYDCALGAHMGQGYFDIVSCGTYNAVVAQCALSGCGLTLAAPPGYLGYQWYTANWTPVASGQIVPCVTPPATPSVFYVVVTPYTGAGCVDTLQTNLVSDITLQLTSDTVCYKGGTPIQINANIGGGIAPLTIQWTGPGLNCYDCTDPISTATGNATYTVKVSDSNNCFRQDTISFFESNFTIDAGDTFTTCIGTPVNINASITPATGNYSVKWTPGAGLSNPNVIAPTFTPSATTLGMGTYVLTVDSGYCRKTDTIQITTLPNDFSLFDTSICQGIGFQIGATGHPDFSYSWTPSIGISDTTIINPFITTDTTRTYTVTASYPTCPNIVKSVTIDVQPVPSVNLGPDTAKCQWDALPINVNVMPNWYSQYTYQWAPNPDLSSNTDPHVIFTGQQNTGLFVKVTTPAGCSGQDSLKIIVHQGNFATLSPPDTAVCPNSGVPMHITGGVLYDWTPGIFLTDSTSSAPVSYPVTDVNYRVVVLDVYGCKDTVFSSITVHSDAVVTLPDSVEIYPGEQYQLNPDGNALYFQWSPPVGLFGPAGVNATSIANPVASPEVSTQYALRATTEGGCTVTDTIDVIVKAESLLDVPNAFSPGAGVNDVLKIVRRGTAYLKSFKIYNRWGGQVFETSNIDEGWDGRLNGKLQPMGVYVYVIEATQANGKRVFRKSGNVTLIR